MDTRESVLRALIEGGGEYISGEALAERLNLSRAAVWKAIRTLKAEGREIEAVTNRGYRLVGGGDVFSAAAVRELACSDGLSISFEREVTGTNAVLKERAAAGAPEGTVLIASHQTAGRGRYGRAFYSPEGTGVYLSIILRPRFEARKAQLITCLAAVAGAKAVEKVSGRKTEIKWVNDILLEGKKICGILTEASLDLESGGLDWAVMGIGFNVADPEGGWGELRGIAGSIFGAAAPAGKRAELAAEFINEFWELYQSFDEKAFLEEYRARQAAVGKRVEVIAQGREPRTAVAKGVDEEFRLVVEYPDGSREALFSGEVRILIKESLG